MLMVSAEPDEASNPERDRLFPSALLVVLAGKEDVAELLELGEGQPAGLRVLPPQQLAPLAIGGGVDHQLDAAAVVGGVESHLGAARVVRRGDQDRARSE